MKPIDLKCIVLNAENLFLLWDQPPHENFMQMTEKQWKDLSTSIFPNKPLKKLKMLAQIIQELDPDVILLSEVGGEESLKNFNNYFLNSLYYSALIEGNSDRSIDVGFLINKRCPFHFQIETNKDRSIDFLYYHQRADKNLPSHKFSRDVAELHLFTQSMNSPFFIFLLTHLKSPLDPEGIDPQGSERRHAELKALLQIYKSHKVAFQCPIAVCGDFNGNAGRNNTEKEFVEIYQETDLEDVLELSQTPPLERNTFFHIRNGGKSEGRQIDFCFLSSEARPLLQNTKTFVYRYQNELGQRPLGPTHLDEKEQLPSDHYPIVFELKNIVV